MRKPVSVACLTITAVGIYLGWVFYARHKANQEFIQRLKAPVEARDQAIYQAYGGGIKIASFYAVPSSIQPDETAQLCYSVTSAESVRIDPEPLEETWPSRSRCVSVKPKKDAVYRLIAKDAQGNVKTAELVVTVRPLPAGASRLQVERSD